MRMCVCVKKLILSLVRLLTRAIDLSGGRIFPVANISNKDGHHIIKGHLV